MSQQDAEDRKLEKILEMTQEVRELRGHTRALLKKCGIKPESSWGELKQAFIDGAEFPSEVEAAEELRFEG